MKCEVLGLEKNFQNIYFGHAFSKACKYTTINEMFFTKNSKKNQLGLHKCIIFF
jgi:hypothetical protein